MTAETGSYRWMAPEVIRHEPYGTSCDVYSYAVLCWEMLSYSIPFPHHTPVEVALSVATKGMRPEMPAHAPSVLVDLIEQCWQQEASLRPSFAKVRRASRRAAPVLTPSSHPSSPPFSPPPRRTPNAADPCAAPPAIAIAGLQ
jgi:serine/threonine protein kinase